jgi:hypothetical protein
MKGKLVRCDAGVRSRPQRDSPPAPPDRQRLFGGNEPGLSSPLSCTWAFPNEDLTILYALCAPRAACLAPGVREREAKFTTLVNNQARGKGYETLLVMRNTLFFVKLLAVGLGSFSRSPSLQILCGRLVCLPPQLSSCSNLLKAVGLRS